MSSARDARPQRSRATVRETLPRRRRRRRCGRRGHADSRRRSRSSAMMLATQTSPSRFHRITHATFRDAHELSQRATESGASMRPIDEDHGVQMFVRHPLWSMSIAPAPPRACRPPLRAQRPHQTLERLRATHPVHRRAPLIALRTAAMSSRTSLGRLCSGISMPPSRRPPVDSHPPRQPARIAAPTDRDGYVGGSGRARGGVG